MGPALDPREGTFRRLADALPERLDRVLRAFRPALSWSSVRDLVARGKVTVGGQVATDPGALIAGGTEVAIRLAARRWDRPAAAAAPALARERIVFCDRFVVVVDKPAGVDTVPFSAKGRLRGVVSAPPAPPLVEQLAAVLGAPVRVVHRIDRDTSGLVMFARTAQVQGRLAHQLRRHRVHRRYLALAHGAVAPGTIRSFLADDRGDGLRGSVRNARIGREAVTHVAVVERLPGATLVACRLETGRTHQIRIHLAEAGHMLLGERGYVREHAGPVLPAPRIMLHAAELLFAHPHSEQPVDLRAEPPADFAHALAALRGGR